VSDGELLIIGKLLLTFAVLLGLPAWELYRLRRERRSKRSRVERGDASEI
jgi:hypothetical protein